MMSAAGPGRLYKHVWVSTHGIELVSLGTTKNKE
jgi:hypothetical protein